PGRIAMNLPTDLSTSRERRVDEAIASYLAALDVGAPPGVEDWLAAYPDLAPELESFLRQYRQVDELADPLPPAPEAEGLAMPQATHPATPSPRATSDPEVTTSRHVAAALIADAPTASAVASDGADGVSAVNGDDHPFALPSGDRVRYFGDYELLRE